MKRQIPLIVLLRALYRLAAPLRVQWRAAKKRKPDKINWSFCKGQDGRASIILNRMDYTTTLWEMRFEITDPSQVVLEGKPLPADRVRVKLLQDYLAERGKAQ